MLRHSYIPLSAFFMCLLLYNAGSSHYMYCNSTCSCDFIYINNVSFIFVEFVLCSSMSSGTT